MDTDNKNNIQNSSDVENKAEVESNAAEQTNTEKKEKIKIEKEHRQKRLFKKRRGGIVLTKEEVKEIKAGRKKLRRMMKEKKVYNKKDFEVTASSLGLYFDKRRLGCLPWFLGRRFLPALLGALAMLLTGLYAYSTITKTKGYFTINMGDDMFNKGFTLSEDKAFTNPSSVLYSVPVEDAPNVSITDIPGDINDYEGSQSTPYYFAYSFFLKYESDTDEAEDYSYEIVINSESKNLSKAAWVMFFVNDEMTFYAAPDSEGGAQAIPAIGEEGRGYRQEIPTMEYLKDSSQYELITSTKSGDYYRIISKPFQSSTVIASGVYEDIKPGEIHKFTVVLWLEGDDPECTDELIGGNLGMEIQFELLDEDK